MGKRKARRAKTQVPRKNAESVNGEYGWIEPGLRRLAVPVAGLAEDAGNARTHNERNLAAIRRSLEGFRQQKPIVIDADGVVVAGNGTLVAARALGWSHVAAVRTTLRGDEARAYALADNRTAELAAWDEDKLAGVLVELKAADIDELLTGFDAKDIARLIDQAAGKGVVQDEVPEPPAKPVTQPGDLWVLGEHRLLCGDSTKAEDVARVMAGERAQCVFTDPPYGVSIAAKNRLLNALPNPDGGNVGGSRNVSRIADGDLSPEQLKTALLPAFRNIHDLVMAEDCTVFVTAPQGGELGMMMMMMQDAKLSVRHVLIWKKNQPTFSLGRLGYDYQHEPILLTWGKRHKRPMQGPHRTSVWSIDKPRESKSHPTMKPVELYTNAYLNNSEQGDVVFDAYVGSGTAIIASEQLGRKCYGIEISPAYCDVAVQRWETLTGRKAEVQHG